MTLQFLPSSKFRTLPDPPHKKAEPVAKKGQAPKEDYPPWGPECVASLGFWAAQAEVLQAEALLQQAQINLG